MNLFQGLMFQLEFQAGEADMGSPSFSTPRSFGGSFSRRAISSAAASGLAAIFGLLAGVTASQAGPCTGQIVVVEQQISQLEAAAPPSGAGEPSAPQSVGAQLHHEPTPGTVNGAEHRANADGDAALARARKADADGKADECAEALRVARHLYGID
jgi:hypothetical protein